MINTNLQIDHQAWAILHLLNKFDLPNVHINAAAWYNGREKGISLNLSNTLSSFGYLVITFGEVRNSDNIFVDAWKVDYPVNPPKVEDFTEEAYRDRTTFKYNETYEAAYHIFNVIKNYCISLR